MYFYILITITWKVTFKNPFTIEFKMKKNTHMINWFWINGLKQFKGEKYQPLVQKQLDGQMGKDVNLKPYLTWNEHEIH